MAAAGARELPGAPALPAAPAPAAPARLEVDAGRLVTRLQQRLAEATTQLAILEIALEDAERRFAALAAELASARRERPVKAATGTPAAVAGAGGKEVPGAADGDQ